MNAQAILQKIEDDAKTTAAQIEAESQAKLTEMRNASTQKIESMHNATIAQANKESDALAERMARMASLEMRKELLDAKRKLMDEAFSEAYKALLNLPTEQLRSFFLNEIVNNAIGDEVLAIGQTHSSWFDDAFLADVNKALSAKNKPANLTLCNEKRADVTGAVLIKSGTEIYCTLESILNDLNTEMETEIASILFEQ